MATTDDLAATEFAVTASRAVAACAGQPVTAQIAQLAGDGLIGLLANEAVGGIDLPLSFAAPVIAAASAALVEVPLIETMLLARHLQTDLPQIAAELVAGQAGATIAWSGQVTATIDGDTVTLNGCVARAPRAADVGWLLVRVGDGKAALVATKDVKLGGPDGIDLAQPEYVAVLDGVRIPRPRLLAEGAWAALQADAHILRAAAILGSAEHCLGLAKEHVSNRRQFGHALAYNQSIRHTLARHKLGLEGMRQAIARALDDASGPRERQVAFIAACNYGVTIVEGAIQMHGGMGFTWDIPVHRYLRRVKALQAQGDASGLTFNLGQGYIAAIAPAA